MDATLKTVAKDSGVFTCMGCNGGDDLNCEISQVNFFVTTLPEGFHISGRGVRFCDENTISSKRVIAE